MPGLPTIKRRQDFLAAASGGEKIVTSCFVLQICKRLPTHPAGDSPRVGFTVTKKMGGAVARNRIRRRLRQAVRQAKPALREAHDYVFISRQKALTCDFDALIRDIGFAFSQIGSK